MKQVYPGRYAARRAVELIKTEGVTFSPLRADDPAHAADGCPTARTSIWPSWKVVDRRGGAAAQRSRRTAIERGIDIFAGYGMSETGPILTIAQLKPSMT